MSAQHSDSDEKNKDIKGWGIKKGATPCSNLVNLKSNTMKNTMQRYGFWANLQINRVKNCVI
jgi:hypothetical protein